MRAKCTKCGCGKVYVDTARCRKCQEKLTAAIDAAVEKARMGK